MIDKNKSKITATIVADSIGSHGIRLTTFQVRVPKYLLQEIARHRVLSLSFNSSRAIPAKVIRSQVWQDPVIPIEWGSNRSGMSAGASLRNWHLQLAKIGWLAASKLACICHWGLSKTGLHKQHVNRILEGFIWADGVISSTNWDNLFALRIHPDAQPEFRKLADEMRQSIRTNQPEYLTIADWHLPYITDDDRANNELATLKLLSASRCARVSYGLKPFDRDADMKRAYLLLNADPKHLSPFEHVASPLYGSFNTIPQSGNYRGWYQFRKEIEDEKN